jgi:hypothetical protein
MANVGKFRYELDENNAVRVWDTEVERPNGNPPMMFQPDYPNGNPFEDAAAAEAWVIEYLNSVLEWETNNPGTEEEETE